MAVAQAFHFVGQQAGFKLNAEIIQHKIMLNTNNDRRKDEFLYF